MHKATRLMREAACQFASGEHAKGQRTIREAQRIAQRRRQYRLLGQCTFLRVCMSEGVYRQRQLLRYYDGLTPRCWWERFASSSARGLKLAGLFILETPVMLVVALWWLVRPWAWKEELVGREWTGGQRDKTES